MALEESFFERYAAQLSGVLTGHAWGSVLKLAQDMRQCWLHKKQIFFCGNGGSAGNAVHLANDYIYGVAKQHGGGIRAHALPANPAILTCLGNDLGYEQVFSEQLSVYANPGDLLVVLSGSGQSPNILAALRQAREMHVKSYAILGYTGGQSLALTDVPIHFPVHDMQMAEDLQLVVGHMVMQWLHANPINQVLSCERMVEEAVV